MKRALAQAFSGAALLFAGVACVAGCDTSSVVHSTTTTEVVLSDTPGNRGCMELQSFTLHVASQRLDYDECFYPSASSNAYTVERGSILLDDAEYQALFFGKMDIMQIEKNTPVLLNDMGTFTADVTDSGETKHYVEVKTALANNGDGLISGCMDAFDFAKSLVDSHLAGHDGG